MNYSYSIEAKQRVVSFLRDYIGVCLKHGMMITGFDDGTALDDITKFGNYPSVEDSVRGTIKEIIENEYDDTGNNRISEEDAKELRDGVGDLFKQEVGT